jgi:hypothetical protein
LWGHFVPVYDFHGCDSWARGPLCSSIYSFHFDRTGESVAFQQDRIFSRHFRVPARVLVWHGRTGAIEMQQWNRIR